MGHDDLAAVGDVAARSIGVADPALGPSARPDAVSRKSFSTIGNGDKGPAVHHRPNSSGGLSKSISTSSMGAQPIAASSSRSSVSICLRALADFSRFAPQSIFSNLATSSSVLRTSSFFLCFLSDFLVTRWAQVLRSAVAAMMWARSRQHQSQHRHRSRRQRSSWLSSDAKGWKLVIRSKWITARGSHRLPDGAAHPVRIAVAGIGIFLKPIKKFSICDRRRGLLGLGLEVQLSTSGVHVLLESAPCIRREVCRHCL